MSEDEHEELCLFVGGPHDSERHTVPVSRLAWRLAERVALPLSPNWQHEITLTPRPVESMQIHTYIRTQWHAGWNVKYIYRHSDLDEGQVLDKLIEGYKSGE